MEKIINITIDGETYLKYKKAYEETQAKKVAIDFGNKSFYSYGWTFYTEVEAIVNMAREYEFIQSKHLEQYQKEITALKNQIEKLKSEITSLKNQIE